MSQTFGDVFRQLVERYGNIVDFNRDEFAYLMGDILEAKEDLDIIMPLIDGIVAQSFSPSDFKRAIGTLHVLLWHLIGHLNALNEAVTIFEDERIKRSEADVDSDS